MIIRKGSAAALVLGLAMILPAVPALSGPYVGGNIGVANIDEDGFEDDSTGAKIFAGFQIASVLAVETSFTKVDTLTDTVGLVSADVEMEAFTIDVLGFIPINDRFSLFGKAGVMFWETEADTTLDPKNDDAGSDLVIGLGVNFDLNKQFAIRAQWDRHDVEDVDIDMYTIGGLFRF